MDKVMEEYMYTTYDVHATCIRALSDFAVRRSTESDCESIQQPGGARARKVAEEEQTNDGVRSLVMGSRRTPRDADRKVNTRLLRVYRTNNGTTYISSLGRSKSKEDDHHRPEDLPLWDWLDRDGSQDTPQLKTSGNGAGTYCNVRYGVRRTRSSPASRMPTMRGLCTTNV